MIGVFFSTNRASIRMVASQTVVFVLHLFFFEISTFVIYTDCYVRNPFIFTFFAFHHHASHVEFERFAKNRNEAMIQK